MGRARAFLMGAASGIVEPIAALLTVLAAGVRKLLPPWWYLSGIFGSQSVYP